MKALVVFGVFSNSVGSAVILQTEERITSLLGQNLNSPRHRFLKEYFARRRPLKDRRGREYEGQFSFYKASAEEIKFFQLAGKLPENSKFWHKLQQKLSQGCSLHDLIRLLEIYALTENLAS